MPGPIYGAENYLLEVVTASLNASYELMFCNMSWASRLPDGSFGGIIGTVQREVSPSFHPISAVILKLHENLSTGG